MREQAPQKMHDGEVLVDVALVRQLLERQFARWAGLPIVPVPSIGTDNAMFRLGDDLVVRLPRVDWAVNGIAREQRWLPWLGKAELDGAGGDGMRRARRGLSVALERAKLDHRK